MQSLANALVYAVVYINCREAADDDSSDNDVGAIESIAGCLGKSNESEKEALAAAAKNALAAERSGPNRQQFVNDLSTWMEDMFGDDWIGNDKATI